MQYKRINEDEMIVYFSERDMKQYHIDFSIFLASDDPAESQEKIYRFLEEIEGGLDFAKEGQLSIQLLPPKHHEGIVLCLRKFPTDVDRPQAVVDELLNILQVGPEAFKERMEQIFSTVDELVAAHDTEEKIRIKTRVPWLITQTEDINNLLQIAASKKKWHMSEQALYYNQGIYTLISEYPMGTSDEVIDKDRVYLNEGTKTVLKDGKGRDFPQDFLMHSASDDKLMKRYAQEYMSFFEG